MLTTRQKTGSADIAATLRREILSGVLIENDRMPSERLMAEKYGVSRGTVREALNQLAREQLVDIRAGSGTYVTFSRERGATMPIENARPLELMDARFALEPHICRLAVLHAGRPELDEMERLLDAMERSVENPTAFAEADTDLHGALARSTGNNLLIWIVTQMNSARSYDEWTRMRQLTLNRQVIARYNVQHRQIVNAIRSREPERAATLMKEHLETARLTLTRAAAA